MAESSFRSGLPGSRRPCSATSGPRKSRAKGRSVDTRIMFNLCRLASSPSLPGRPLIEVRLRHPLPLMIRIVYVRHPAVSAGPLTLPVARIDECPL